jgi:hypothetical protein
VERRLSAKVLQEPSSKKAHPKSGAIGTGGSI